MTFNFFNKPFNISSAPELSGGSFTFNWKSISANVGQLIKEFLGYPIQTAYTLAGNAINWKWYGNSKQEYITIGDVQYKLPENYTVLDYAQNASATKVNTGVTPTVEDCEYYCRFYANGTGSLYLFTSRGGTTQGSTQYGISGSTTGGTITFSLSGTTIASSITRTVGHIYTVKATCTSAGAMTLYVKDETDGTEASNTDTVSSFTAATSPIYLFGNNAQEIEAGYRIYQAYYKEAGEMKVNVVPMKNSSDTVGYYDFVSNTFLTATSGSLTAGTEGVSPDRVVDVVSVGDKNYDIPYELYTPVEYIESSGTQYIDTGLKITTNYVKASAKITPLQYNGGSTDQRSWGVQYNSSTCFTAWDSGVQNPDGWLALGSSWYVGKSSSTFFNTSLNTPYEFDFTADSGNVSGTYAGESFNTTYDGTVVNSTNIYLFKCNSSFTPSKTRIHRFSIETASGSRNFIPVLRKSDSTYGMYDTVTQAFYVNSGTGTFTGGSARTDLYKIPIKVNDQLPAGYTELEYLKTTGTQWIDTNFTRTAGNTYKMEVDLKVNANGGLFTLGADYMGYYVTALNGNQVGVSATAVFTDDWTRKVYTLTQGSDGKTCTLTNGTDSATYTRSSANYGYGVNIGRYWSTSGANSYANFYSAKLYQNGILIGNYIPAKRNSDSVLGMYDLVSDTFFTNAGTGTFVAGEEVGIVTAYLDEPLRKVGSSYSDYIYWGNGKNLLDMSDSNIEVGYYINGTTGVITANDYNWCLEGYVPCKPNTAYTFSFSTQQYYISLAEYTEDKTFIVRNTTRNTTSISITTGSTTKYLKVGTNPTGSLVVTLDYVKGINWQVEEGSTATTYKSYSLTPKVVRNIGVKVLDGTESWAEYTRISNCFYLGLADSKASQGTSILCTHYQGKAQGTDDGVYCGATNIGSVQCGAFYFTDTSFADVTAWKAYVAEQYANGTPITLTYGLISSTTETATIPALTLAAGTDIVTTNTTVVPSDGYVKAYVSRL